jgi:hypothetical protein
MTNKTKMLREKLNVILMFVKNTYEEYFNENTSSTQRDLYAVIIGAGIFYLPSGKTLYSGLISTEAMDLLYKDKKVKLVKEHSFPRKVGGRLLYELYRQRKEKNQEFTLDDLHNLYLNRIGKYNYVLKTENDKLKKFQKLSSLICSLEFFEIIHNIEFDSYIKAGISLCKIDYEEINRLRKN